MLSVAAREPFWKSRWFSLLLIVVIILLVGVYFLCVSIDRLSAPKAEGPDPVRIQALHLENIVQEMAGGDDYFGWPRRAADINSWLGASRGQLKEPFHGHVIEVIDVDRYGQPPERLAADTLHNKLGYYSDGHHYLIVGWGLNGEPRIVLEN